MRELRSEDLPEQLRVALAERPRRDDGAAVCGCGAVLGELDFLCASCEDKRRSDDEARVERERRLKRISSKLSAVPLGLQWVDDLAQYEARCKSRRLRNVAERYELSVGNLVLSGPTGVGKTLTLARIARRLIRSAWEADRGSPARDLHWASALALTHARRRHELGQGEAPAIERAMNCDVLALDDLGFEQVTDTWFVELMDARYLAGRVTLCTTGATPAALRARYGDAAYRKLIEPRGAVIEDWPAGESGG